jgi:lipopolysaccharide biosynthesis protein
MVAGRPRTATPTDDELIVLGQEMVEWVRMNRPVHLNQWWLINKNINRKVWDSMRHNDKFFHYYDVALSMIGNNYIDKDSNVDPRVKDRFLRLYHKDLRDQEDADARFNASLKTEINTDESAVRAINRVMDYVAKAQSENKDFTNNNTESTS